MAPRTETSQTTTINCRRSKTQPWPSLAAPSTSASHRARCRYRRRTWLRNSIIHSCSMRASLCIRMCSSSGTLGYHSLSRRGYSHRGKLRDPPKESLLWIIRSLGGPKINMMCSVILNRGSHSCRVVSLSVSMDKLLINNQENPFKVKEKLL